jgi:peptidoglycan DL-endopeptidase CwlO
MFARGHARLRGSTRATRAVGASLALLVLLVAALLAQPAGADSISSLKAQAQAAQARIDALNVAAEKKIEAYDAVHGRYLHTKAQLAATKRNLRIAQANLKASEIQLAHTLRDSYKSGGQDPLMYVLAAKSFSDLVDEMQLLQRRSNTSTSLVQSIGRYRATVHRQKVALAAQTARLAKEDSQLAAAKNAALASLSAAKAYKSSLDSRIQKAIAARQAAQQAAAARAAAAAQAASSTSGGSAPPPNIPVPPSSGVGGQAVAIAQQYLGVPYVWGGASPSGFDCSGLTMYVYAQLGISLPHNAAAQYASLPHVPLSDLQPGDLVFFYGLGHVGIYVGNGTMIHAPHTGAVVSYASISTEGPIDGAARPG